MTSTMRNETQYLDDLEAFMRIVGAEHEPHPAPEEFDLAMAQLEADLDEAIKLDAAKELLKIR